MVMDEKPKKSLRTLGQHQPADSPRPSIVSGIKKAAMAQSEATRQAPPPGPHLPHQGFAPLAPPKPQTYSLRVERIRQLSDEQLMQYLTRESVPSDGVMDEGAKMAITMELMRRQSKRLEPAAWWRDRNYLAALAAAVCGAIATTLVAWDLLWRN